MKDEEEEAEIGELGDFGFLILDFGLKKGGEAGIWGFGDGRGGWGWLVIFVMLMGGVSGCRSPQRVVSAPTATNVMMPVVSQEQMATVDVPTPAVTPSVLVASVATAGPTTLPTLTVLPAVSATPAATVPMPRQLTSGGCCWEPFLLDGRVTFLDRPGEDAPVGFYSVPPAGGTPVLVEARIGTFHNGGAFFVYFEGGRTMVERRSDGQQWAIYNEEQPVMVSPDGLRVAWMKREWDGSVEERYMQFWWMALGGRPEFVTGILGGGLIEWLADGRWLGAGRLRHGATDGVLFVYEPVSKERIDLFTASWFRGVAASPDGQWVIFLVGQEALPERNGLWLARTDGSELRKLDWFGAYGWRDDSSLYYLPFRPGADADEVWLYDVASGDSRRLSDPAVTRFKVAQGNFLITAEGLVYVSAEDDNLWLLPLLER